MDAELFEVLEDLVAFGRQYKAGSRLRESDLASWCISEADQEMQIAEFLTRGMIEMVVHEMIEEPS